MPETVETPLPTNMTVVLASDESHPSITLNHSSTPYTANKLSKAKGNYQQWYEDMLIHLMGSCLFYYIEGDSPIPSATSEPCAHKTWLTNNHQAWSIIAGSIDPSERVYIKLENGSTTMVKAAWTTLKPRHKNKGPICQVNLLQKALAAKCTKDMSLPEMGHQICKDIKQAFTIGTLNQNFLCCITLMNVLEDFLHLHTTVSTSLTNSKSGAYTSEDILLLLETEQSLHDTDTLKRNHNDQITESTALAVQQSKSSRSTSSNAPFCTSCKCSGHTHPYCILTGGGMEGKTIHQQNHINLTSQCKVLQCDQSALM
ncbi:uncharacterized protein LACBIDRAFT_334482 [Laccaria bicolor S238N-H82]|uniref:Predicted protein n=1 Tax=Laccaria bicolor (strain S238N-H82 / ATCC MYA-4686) TaxID=486041 RepID=B0DZB3_LACBS|nr:uncharacterized protein LACBIDRAFT_334482 [Laccaria bicolor S238N-H82]EDR00089.1 predicted protein [Laccaria bicolor S238N-H82]|eukprot:XP_001889295.1 predicted protein [Laccaria bicolor S238N-H82]